MENVIESKFSFDDNSVLVGFPYILQHINGNKQLVVCCTKTEDVLTFNTYDEDNNPRVLNISPELFNKEYSLYTVSSSDFIDQINIPSDTTTPPNSEFIRNNSYYWCRTINYSKQTISSENNDLSVLFSMDTTTVTITRFLYRITRDIDKDNGFDLCRYEVTLPISTSDEREFIKQGFKVHPMFYDDERERMRGFVNINRTKYLYNPDNNPIEDSITLEIVSGIQLLYLIEFGLFKGKEATMYRGITYDSGMTIVSNAYIDCDNQLVLNEHNTDIFINNESGYINRFMYNEYYDWLFIPEETTDNVNKFTDSTFVPPTIGETNIIYWGGYQKFSGPFRFNMNDDYYNPGCKNYIYNWYFTGDDE